MKMFITAMFAMAFVTIGAAADDFDYMQHDFSASVGDRITASARVNSGGADYVHGQVDVNLTEDTMVGFRYTDADGITEYRGHVAYQLYADDTFYLTPIASYHYLDGDVEGDYVRAGLRAGGQHLFGERFTVWGWHEPRVVYADGEFNFIGSKSEVGVSVPIGPAQIGPFVQAYLDDSYENPTLIAGTKVSVTF